MNDKIDEAIDKVEQADARPAPQAEDEGPGVVVKVRVAQEAHAVGPGQFLKLSPKPSSVPTILVWIPEQGVYQPVFIQPGKWVLAEEEKFTAAKPPIWVPK